MLDNSRMIANRYATAHYYKKIYKSMIKAMEAGYRIQVSTYLVSRVYSRPEQFKLRMDGIYAQRGKHWDCINYSAIRSVS